MEILLAIVVASAVIFFGALISMGNERQRRAIDQLGEQIELWAIQDLRIKREHFLRTVEVSDPIIWLNRIIEMSSGRKTDLSILEFYENPDALICIDNDGSRILFSLLSPKEITRWQKQFKGKLKRHDNTHPICNFTKLRTAVEISILNGGFIWDLEAPIAWEKLTKKRYANIDKLYCYFLPENNK